MAKLTLLLVCVAVAAATAEGANPAAGASGHWKPFPSPISSPSSPRIVDGVEAKPHSWPHQVHLQVNSDNGMFLCGGSLISEEWVLTAAHCVDKAKETQVKMGAHNITEDEPTQVNMLSQDFIVHEDWGTNSNEYDIAVIRLPSPVTFNEYIQAVKLPSDDVSAGDVLIATGWGQMSGDDPRGSDVLREVEVSAMSESDCNELTKIPDGAILCAVGEGAKTTCMGDSGGPLNKDGKIYGISSFGMEVNCPANKPFAFTRVSHYLDWIKSNTGVTP